MLAFVIAAVLIGGVVAAGVRSSREGKPVAQPTVTASPTPSATETETVEPSPSVTMTFTGLPPFQNTITPSPPSPSPGDNLPRTGDGGLVPVAAITLLMAVAAGGALARAR